MIQFDILKASEGNMTRPIKEQIRENISLADRLATGRQSEEKITICGHDIVVWNAFNNQQQKQVGRHFARQNGEPALQEELAKLD